MNSANCLKIGLALIGLAAPVHAADIESGKKLFAADCSVGYCHGAEGRAGRGPRLRDREWDRGYLLKVIDEGIPNSSMPAWHGKLTSDQMRSIVAYILSISKEVAQPDAAGSPISPGASPGAPQSKAARAGQALFFDSANDSNCGACHKVKGAGGDAGPDLGRMASLPPEEILRAILNPPSSARYAGMEIATKGGETIRGIVFDETPSRLRFYDLTAPGPPVLRSFNPSDIVSRHPVKLPLHEKFGELYSQEQLAQLVAFIK